MASRSGRRRVDHSSPLVDLDDVFADDALIDALAAGPWGADRPLAVTAGNGAGRGSRHVLTADPLTDLFDSWRQELSAAPIPAPPPVRKPAAQQRAAARRRSHRPMLAIAGAIAVLLVGSTFATSRVAGKDSVLWGVTTVLWPDRVQSVASRERVISYIEQAQTALANDEPAALQAALLGATFEIGQVDDIDRRDELKSQLEVLWKQAGQSGTEVAPTETSGPSTGKTPSPQTRSAAGTAAQQLAMVDAPAPQATSTNGPEAVNVAVAALPTSDDSAAGANSGTSSGGSGSASGSSSGGANSSGSSSAGVLAAAVKPSETPEAASEDPSSPPSSTPVVEVPDPATSDPTEEPTTSGSTESAPAPTPSTPTSAVTEHSVKQTPVEMNAGSEVDNAADPMLAPMVESTPVLPTP